jgi:hypothetical protein
MKASQIAVGTLPSPLKLRAIGDLAAFSVQDEKQKSHSSLNFRFAGESRLNLRSFDVQCPELGVGGIHHGRSVRYLRVCHARVSVSVAIRFALGAHPNTPFHRKMRDISAEAIGPVSTRPRAPVPYLSL